MAMAEIISAVQYVNTSKDVIWQRILGHYEDGMGRSWEDARAQVLVHSTRVGQEELRGFALGMRSLARKPNIEAGIEAVDIVGTGGDKSGSFTSSASQIDTTPASGPMPQ